MCHHDIAYKRCTRYNIADFCTETVIQPRGKANVVRGSFRMSPTSKVGETYRPALQYRINLHLQIGIKRIPWTTENTDQASQEAALTRELAVWCTLSTADSNVLELLGTVTFGDQQKYLPLSSVFHFYENGDLIKIKDATAGVKYIHNHKIVHGDLKQGNVLVDNEGCAKICDFGSAYSLEECHPCPVASPSDFRNLMTEIYLSPEVWDDDEAHTTYQSDIWALGCLLFEVSGSIQSRFDVISFISPPSPHQVQTGRRVYNGTSDFQISCNMGMGHPPATAESFSANEIIQAVGRVALACLSTEPHERPTADQVYQQLSEINDIAN
ncbi:hypothetical protein FRC12_023625 [Ceratobasidium sp. 428]|nr:hypothetical protein FRC12_023625 [Ceratobasidium sp. 428]